MVKEAFTNLTRRTQDVTHVETVIVGAGPAGLAVAGCLRRAGIPLVILEREDRVGASWHRHYDRLHLHTDKAHSALPYLPLPKDYPRYPSRDQLVAYLESYAGHFGLEPRFGQEVLAARLRDGRWQTWTRDTLYLSRFLVMATGHNARAHLPKWPGQEAFSGEVVHSSVYKNGAPYRGKRVLVVGFGNSGGEIAVDLFEHGAMPALSVRGPVNVIPRDVLGLPILAIAIPLEKLPTRLADALAAPVVRLAFGNLGRVGLQRAAEGPFGEIERRGRIPLIDVGTIGLIKKGAIDVRPGVERFDGQDVVFVDGTRDRYDAVVLATGYRPTVDALLERAPLLTDEHGSPCRSGREAAQGLYFCGFHVSPTGMLREIAMEAKRIATDIASEHAGALSQREDQSP
ncbi:MAG: NAD(P)/FAD-dependent oxidoreductase [Actinomycetota bacterium]|nr:NAD(P)/FAD-dependent oxidoreductase [Actinomycetota bacterium]